MRASLSTHWFIATVGTIACLSLPPGASAQTRTIPRTPDGKPDLSGIWRTMNAAAWNLEAHEGAKDVPAGPSVVDGGTIPYQPWALAKRKENFESRATADPEARCIQLGVPRTTYAPYPFQIVQTPQQISVVYEYAHSVRNIFMGGTPHPKGPIEWWLGDSRGRWEGDTLVVDVVHFNGDTWLDKAGNFHSPDLHVVERYTLMDADHIEYEVTLEDAKVFTAPWKIRMPLYRRVEKDVQLLEYECYAFENRFKATPP